MALANPQPHELPDPEKINHLQSVELERFRPTFSEFVEQEDLPDCIEQCPELSIFVGRALRLDESIEKHRDNPDRHTSIAIFASNGIRSYIADYSRNCPGTTISTVRSKLRVFGKAPIRVTECTIKNVRNDTKQ